MAWSVSTIQLGLVLIRVQALVSLGISDHRSLPAGYFLVDHRLFRVAECRVEDLDHRSRRKISPREREVRDAGLAPLNPESDAS